MDVVVTVPRDRWLDWLAEGDLPGMPWTGLDSYFRVPRRPDIQRGERVYIVAHGRVRGYAPLVKITEHDETWAPLPSPAVCLVRRDGAVAVTIFHRVQGFQGFRYRWWRREQERPWPVEDEG